MYGHLPTMWRPYLPHYDGKIADAASRLADSMFFTAFVEHFDLSDEFTAGVPASAPTVLIIDPWAIRDTELQQRLARFDSTSHTKLWIRPVVAWNRGHEANKVHAAILCSDLADALDQCRRRYRSDSPQVLDGLESIHQFITELPDVIRLAEKRYLSEIAPDPPPSASAPARPKFGGPAPGFSGSALHVPNQIPPRSTARPPVQSYLELQRRQENSNPEGP
jgi:FxsC-like protein